MNNVNIIDRIMMLRFDKVIWPSISDMVFAEPVLALFIVYRATKLRVFTVIPTPPIRNKNERSSFSLFWDISEAIREAWPEPMPGRKEQRRLEIKMENWYLISKNLLNIKKGNLDIFWSGRFTFSFMLIIIPERPKSPLSKGKRGSFIGELNVSRPRNPERR